MSNYLLYLKILALSRNLSSENIVGHLVGYQTLALYCGKIGQDFDFKTDICVCEHSVSGKNSDQIFKLAEWKKKLEKYFEISLL